MLRMIFAVATQVRAMLSTKTADHMVVKELCYNYLSDLFENMGS